MKALHYIRQALLFALLAATVLLVLKWWGPPFLCLVGDKYAEKACAQFAGCKWAGLKVQYDEAAHSFIPVLIFSRKEKTPLAAAAVHAAFVREASDSLFFSRFYGGAKVEGW